MDFSQARPQEMAAWSGADFLCSPLRLRLAFCGYRCEVFHPQGDMEWEAPEALSANERVLILQYLVEATGLPRRERWLSFLELPGGPHHHALFRQEALAPLAAQFARCPQNLLTASSYWGGQETKGYGDAASIIPVLPRLSLLAMVWGEDDEFPARAALLFEESAPGYLTTAALYVLGIGVVQRIIEVHPRQ